jgi:hypothetical protein
MSEFTELETYLLRVPSIQGHIGKGRFENGNWWVKFSLDIDHALAWSVVQEFGTVLNYLSITERLPTVFKPVSPPSYLNGGPREFLSWVIESTKPDFAPKMCAEWLEGRLPRPVDGLSNWLASENLDDE